jgi:phosphate transport system permease protein
MILKRYLFDRITGTWMVTALVTILLLPLIIGIALYLKALPLFEIQNLPHLIGSSEWSPTDGKFGFWPFITSSVYVTILSFIFAAPVCLLAGIYLTQFASENLIRIMHPVIYTGWFTVSNLRNVGYFNYRTLYRRYACPVF